MRERPLRGMPRTARPHARRARPGGPARGGGTRGPPAERAASGSSRSTDASAFPRRRPAPRPSPVAAPPGHQRRARANARPYSRSRDRSPAWGTVLRVVAVDALRVLERHALRAARRRSDDVFDFEFGRIPDLPAGVAHPGAEVDVLDVHEVVLVE